MNRHIILLNGPPQCGKDTFALISSTHTYNAYILKFAEPLEQALSTLSGYQRGSEEFQHIREECKDDPILNGYSPRSFMQEYSELFAKKFFGQDVFGKMCAKKVNTILDHVGLGNVVIFVTDCGFQNEVDAFINGITRPCTTHLVRIHRDGCSYRSDTREWVFNNSGLINTETDLYNNGDKNKYEHDVLNFCTANNINGRPE